MRRILLSIALVVVCTGFTPTNPRVSETDDTWRPTLRVPLTLYHRTPGDPPRLLYLSGSKLPELDLCGLDGTATKCSAGGLGKFWCGVDCSNVGTDYCYVYCRDKKTYACCSCDYSKAEGYRAKCVCKVARPD